MQAWKAIQKNDRLDEPRNLTRKIFIFVSLKKMFFFYTYKAIKMGVGLRHWSFL